MKIKLALEWFINPDHLPFIVGLDKGLYKKNNIDLEVIEPEGNLVVCRCQVGTGVTGLVTTSHQ